MLKLKTWWLNMRCKKHEPYYVFIKQGGFAAPVYWNGKLFEFRDAAVAVYPEAVRKICRMSRRQP